LISGGESWSEFRPWQQTVEAQHVAAVAAARLASRLRGYQEAWAEEGFDPAGLTLATWDKVPFLSKDMLIAAALAAPPFGNRLGVPRESLAHVFVAPGPLYMPFTASDFAQVATSFAKAFAACGLDSTDLVDQTTMYNWVMAATAIDRALQSIGCAVVPGGVGQSERHIEVIHQLNATAIVAFPTFLEHLLDLAVQQGVTLPLRKAVVMGELSDPEAKRRFRTKYGLSVREFYGVADVGAVAWECEACDGMHLRDDLFVEFVAPGTATATSPSRDAPAEIVVTDLGRDAMPIIRLRTGDLVDELKAGPCACGRTAPRFGRIVGRASEITKVKGMFVVPRQVQDVLRGQGLERPFRLIVERRDGGRDELTLEIAGEHIERTEELRRLVENALRLRIGLKLVESLPPNGPRLVDLRLSSAGSEVEA
jgi:phenylacetate-CoA ligase